MTRPRIGIIISSTRQRRLGERVARWIEGLAAAHSELQFELVDLRGYPLPMFDEPTSPRFVPVDSDVARRWAAKMAELDGYVFVTAEYNRSITGVLKNALDHIYSEPARKPAAFVGYGAVGGARAVEQLRLICIELSMVPMKAGVHVGMEPMLGLMQQGKDFADYPYLTPTVTTMLDELSWYARTLKAGRDAVAEEAVAA
jgi:NAD(P)H-dependent FMN reductase